MIIRKTTYGITTYLILLDGNPDWTSIREDGQQGYPYFNYGYQIPSYDPQLWRPIIPDYNYTIKDDPIDVEAFRKEMETWKQQRASILKFPNDISLKPNEKVIVALGIERDGTYYVSGFAESEYPEMFKVEDVQGMNAPCPRVKTLYLKLLQTVYKVWGHLKR